MCTFNNDSIVIGLCHLCYLNVRDQETCRRCSKCLGHGNRNQRKIGVFYGKVAERRRTSGECMDRCQTAAYWKVSTVGVYVCFLNNGSSHVTYSTSGFSYEKNVQAFSQTICIDVDRPVDHRTTFGRFIDRQGKLRENLKSM